MFSHAKLPKSFWDERIRIAVDLINISLSILFNGDVPKKVWIRKGIYSNPLK